MTVEFSFGTWLCPQYNLTLDWHFFTIFWTNVWQYEFIYKVKNPHSFFFKLLYVLLKFVYLITEYKRRKNIVFKKRWVKKGPVDFNFCSFQSNYREASLSVFKTAVCLSLFHSVCVCVCVSVCVCVCVCVCSWL